MSLKGIILAGGLSSRLYPATKVITKQLVPIYDKPMIYYPLTTLMMANIKEVLFITNPSDSHLFKLLLGDGSQWGMKFEFVVQDSPRGLADAFIVGEKFVDGKPVTMILGDNIFWGHGFIEEVRNGIYDIFTNNGATVFSYWVNDPERYGVAEFDPTGKVVHIEEKPKEPKSNYAITGLYCYDGNVSEYAHQVKPSARGEIEITTLNQMYLDKGLLRVKKLGRGVAWLDTGTHEAMSEASLFVETIQKRQGQLIACPEEIAYQLGYITAEQVLQLAEPMKKNHYGQYLISMVK